MADVDFFFNAVNIPCNLRLVKIIFVLGTVIVFRGLKTKGEKASLGSDEWGKF